MTEIRAGNVTGSIESLSPKEIGGWVLVAGEPPIAPNKLVLRLAGQTMPYVGEFRPRPDWEGKACGFSFQLPEHFRNLTPVKILDEFEGVFVISDNDPRLAIPVGLYKASLLNFAGQVVTAINESERASRKIAILVRTHIDSPKVRDLCVKLGALRGATVAISADETKEKLDFGPFRKLSHSVKNLVELGFKIANDPGALFFYGDLPFYSALNQMSDCNFYLMIEYDVDFNQNGIIWLQQLIDRLRNPSEKEIDFFAPRWGASHSSWYWHDHAKSTMGNRNIYNAFFPIIGLSKAAAHYLAAYRQRYFVQMGNSNANLLSRSLSNGQPYCEYFVPTVLASADIFQLMSARALELPDGLDFFGDFTVHRPILFGNDWSKRSAILHPVLDEDQYLRKLKHFARTDNNIENWRCVAELIKNICDDRMRNISFDVIGDFQTKFDAKSAGSEHC